MATRGGTAVCECVRVCARARVCLSACVCVCVCVCMCMCRTHVNVWMWCYARKDAQTKRCYHYLLHPQPSVASAPAISACLCVSECALVYVCLGGLVRAHVYFCMLQYAYTCACKWTCKCACHRIQNLLFLVFFKRFLTSRTQAHTKARILTHRVLHTGHIRQCRRTVRLEPARVASAASQVHEPDESRGRARADEPAAGPDVQGLQKRVIANVRL
jgi:hypothetical protein